MVEIVISRGRAQIRRRNGEGITRIVGSIEHDAKTSTAIPDPVRAHYALAIQAEFSAVQAGIGGAMEAQMETRTSIMPAYLVGLIGVHLIRTSRFRSSMRSSR